jgi:hypothetical protein
MFNLLEDNQSVLDLIRYVDSKVVELRNKKGLDPEVMAKLSEVYGDVVDPWMENNYLKDVEPDIRWEEEIQDKLFTLISYINSIK